MNLLGSQRVQDIVLLIPRLHILGKSLLIVIAQHLAHLPELEDLVAREAELVLTLFRREASSNI